MGSNDRKETESQKILYRHSRINTQYIHTYTHTVSENNQKAEKKERSQQVESLIFRKERKNVRGNKHIYVVTNIFFFVFRSSIYCVGRVVQGDVKQIRREPKRKGNTEKNKKKTQGRTIIFGAEKITFCQNNRETVSSFSRGRVNRVCEL